MTPSEQKELPAEKMTLRFLEILEAEHGIAGVETAMAVIKARIDCVRAEDLTAPRPE
jgi:hypothetical protein